jgi:hypothetical protein
MVEIDRQRKNVEPTTREGVKRRILAVTDDEELAEKVATEFAVKQKLASMAANNQGMKQ